MEQELEIDLNGDVISGWFWQETAEIFCRLCGKGGTDECIHCANKNPYCG
jgi:hypothetical protein